MRPPPGVLGANRPRSPKKPEEDVGIAVLHGVHQPLRCVVPAEVPGLFDSGVLKSRIERVSAEKLNISDAKAGERRAPME
jgi:hypothetical protein